jgi:hypothetical protein
MPLGKFGDIAQSGFCVFGAIALSGSRLHNSSGRV